MMLNIENEPLQEQLLPTKVQREGSADIQGLREVSLRHVWVEIFERKLAPHLGIQCLKLKFLPDK